MGHRSLLGKRGWQNRPGVGRRRGGLLARVVLLAAVLLPLVPALAQEAGPDLDAQVEALLAEMTSGERVGQLFLVTFVGNDASPGSDVGRLIREDHVGGVVLLASNSNFYNEATTPRQVAELSNTLQGLAMGGGAGVPLWVAVDHEGDDYPYTRIRGGTTTLPNAMAIGATWDTTLARDVGQIAGLELAAMGINLLLGPSVDVLEDPRPGGQGDIGTRTFGGDPWWVGEMGRAYVEGVHRGSGGRVATVAKHFPGHGSSDRLPDEEVSTVDKSLEELQRVELAPFLAVTGGDGAATTDALMSSHIRYRGFQGNIRQFTAPISFDAEGMAAILSLEPLASWRPTGLMVSDSLGVPAVRRYFDPALDSFPHRRIAKEAFLAGNDLLLLAQFDLDDVWADQLANIHDTINFFGDEYEGDPAFASRVDEAVRRILRLKLRLYPEPALEAVQVPPEAALQVCGLGGEVTQMVADRALTLLYPDPNAVPPPPSLGEKILILTDARPVRECFTDRCQPFTPLARTAVEEAILRGYGPEGTGQVRAEDVTSLPFGQLKAFLAGQEAEADVGALLAEADWIILAQQDLNLVKAPNSDAVQLFLDSPLAVAHDARLVVLAFNAPYYLDTTEISKLSLYLAVYGKTPSFVRAAVRALFGELVPQGAPPVDVAGINYDLQRQLRPDPEQSIPLVIEVPAGGGPALAPVEVGLLAGPIVDGNGHPVPDGTEVTFYGAYEEGVYLPPVSAATVGGKAQASLRLEAAGRVQFRVESGAADQSQVVSLAVEAASPVIEAETTPTASPSVTVAPTATVTKAPTATPAVTPSPVVGPVAGSGRPVGGGDLSLAAAVTALVAAAGALWLAGRRRSRPAILRGVLWAVIGGAAGYLLYAGQLLRPEAWGILPAASWAGQAALAAVVAIGALLPLGLVIRATGPGR